MLEQETQYYQKNHFKVLDSWRGICACMVALFHFQVYNHIYDVPLFWNSGYYVDFFFVLSGFVIFANYEDKLRNGFDLRKFMLIRFGRIYPLHFMTLILFVLHELAQLALPVAQGISAVAPFQGPGEGGYEIFINLLLLHSFNLVGVYSFNSPSWSISAEFFTYLLFAVLIAKFWAQRFIWTVGILTGGVIMFAFYDGEGMTHDWGILRCIYGFAAGGLCWRVWKSYSQLFYRYLSAFKVWTLTEIASVSLAIYLICSGGQAVISPLTPFIFAVLIFIFAFEKGALSKILLHKGFVLIGTLSYSIYMLHAFIAWKLIAACVDVFQHVSGLKITTTIDGHQKIGLEKWQGDLLSIFYLGMVILASHLSYRFFEIPCRNYCRKKAEIWFRKSSPDT